MTDRIKDLAEQAREFATTRHPISNITLIFDKVKFEKKFAELIVRECAGIGYDASYYECASNVSNKIKEHFGVEE